MCQNCIDMTTERLDDDEERLHHKACGEHLIFEIPSSGEEPHRVLLCSGEWMCGCKSFTFRHRCSHVPIAQAKYEKLDGVISRRTEEKVREDAQSIEKIYAWEKQLERQTSLSPESKQRIQERIEETRVRLRE